MAPADTDDQASQGTAAAQVDQTQAQTQGDAQTQDATQAATQGDAQVTDQTQDDKSKDAAAQAQDPTRSPWYIRRINQLTAEKKSLERAQAQANAELELARGALEAGAKTGQKQQQSGLSAEEINARVRTEAQQLAKQEQFNRDCDTIAADGVAKFPDFGAKIGALTPILGEQGIPPSLIDAALETGKAAEVLYAMASDLNEASRILSLSPTKQAVAMERIAQGLAKPPAPKKVSQTPTPVKPLAGTVVVDKDPEKMSNDEWFAWREKQVADRRKSGEYVQ